MIKHQAAYRKIVRKTWRKVKFRQEPDEIKLFLLYIWTGPETAMPGFYYLAVGTVADDLGIDLETVSKRFRYCIANGWLKYDFEARLVFLPKWTEYDPPANKNVVISYMRQTLDLPRSTLTHLYVKTLERYIKRFGIPLPNGWETVSKPFRIHLHSHSHLHSQLREDNKRVAPPKTGDTAPENKLFEGEIRIGGEIVLEEELKALAALMENLPYVPDKRCGFKLAGWLVKKCGSEVPVAAALFHEEANYLSGLKNEGAFYATMTDSLKNPEKMGKVKSEAYKQI